MPSPVFILSSIRSGSTLLRCILDTHPLVHAPHELHLGDLRVDLSTELVDLAMTTLGVQRRQIEYLLWDRLLYELLRNSGKRIIVDKTPSNVLMWRRLAECWAGARYVFLLRHPADIATSAVAARPERSAEDMVDMVFRFTEAVEEARSQLTGLTVRYEDLTAQPEKETRQLCDFLGVPWDPAMLDYGQVPHGPFVPGIGDWGENIRSGRIQPARPLAEPADVPAVLVERCRTWGYLS